MWYKKTTFRLKTLFVKDVPNKNTHKNRDIRIKKGYNPELVGGRQTSSKVQREGSVI